MPRGKRWKPTRPPIVRVRTDPPEYKLWLKLQTKRATLKSWRGVGGFYQFMHDTGGLFVDICDRRQHTLDILRSACAKRTSNSDEVRKEDSQWIGMSGRMPAGGLARLLHGLT